MDCPDCGTHLSRLQITGTGPATYRCEDCGVTIEVTRDHTLPDGVTGRSTGGSGINVAPGREVPDGHD